MTAGLKNDTTSEIWHGLYSVDGERRSGSSVYESLDQLGETVIVSLVVRTKQEVDYFMEAMKDDNIEYRGRVGKFIRNEKQPEYKSHMRNIVYKEPLQ